MPELRYHPFRQTWVLVAPARQDRTYHPQDGECPLCPSADGRETEIPFPDYDIAVFENRFPSLEAEPGAPSHLGGPLCPTLPATGVCEVVCYSADHDATLAVLPLNQVRKLVRVWRDRYLDLSAREGLEYIFIFENKGREIGVTLSHPHGQIYAYPFIPETPRLELAAEREHWNQTGRSLYDDWLLWEVETERDARVVDSNAHFVSLVPFFARYPYEVHIVALPDWPSLAPMTPAGLDDLADILHRTVRRLDSVFGFSMPYIMAIHQEPAVPGYAFTRFHIEFYPPHRTAEKLKFLAGSEAGAGAFIVDAYAEDSAAKLRAVQL